MLSLAMLLLACCLHESYRQQQRKSIRTSILAAVCRQFEVLLNPYLFRICSSLAAAEATLCQERRAAKGTSPSHKHRRELCNRRGAFWNSGLADTQA